MLQKLAKALTPVWLVTSACCNVLPQPVSDQFDSTRYRWRHEITYLKREASEILPDGATPADWGCRATLVGDEICGDGQDNDCDGTVDEKEGCF